MAVLDVRVSAEGAESLCRDRHNATLADISSDANRMNLSFLLVRNVFRNCKLLYVHNYEDNVYFVEDNILNSRKVLKSICRCKIWSIRTVTLTTCFGSKVAQIGKLT